MGKAAMCGMIGALTITVGTIVVPSENFIRIKANEANKSIIPTVSREYGESNSDKNQMDAALSVDEQADVMPGVNESQATACPHTDGNHTADCPSWDGSQATACLHTDGNHTADCPYRDGSQSGSGSHHAESGHHGGGHHGW